MNSDSDSEISTNIKHLLLYCFWKTMNKLPKHLFCTLKDDLKNLDYSKWERSKTTNGFKSTEARPILWASAGPARQPARPSHRPISEQHGESTPHTEVKHVQSEKAGRSRESSIQESPTAPSRLSRRTQNKRWEDKSVSMNDTTKIQQRSGAAYSKWSTMQITQARAELRDTVQEAKNQLSGLQVKLEAVMAQVLDARTELHTLKTYKDKEYPVKALQIANMKVDLDKLQKAQQDECDDVSVLCQTEMASLEKQLQQKEQEVLSAIAKQSVSCVPPLVKHMVLHNHTMKREIKLHKQEIMELEEENSALLRNIQALQLLRPNCSKEVFNVFPKSDRCDPDIDVHLSVKRHDCLPI
ncbi:uncharacterized protein C20orf96-like isoform X2 [Brachyhypopomus gauderio]|uniref:uncharacterized protein C20orf96-like isoform X2 n=1 Tax=Brachyhypopomus gauderio TaxID=698409 RepID=UPI004042C8C7